MDIPMTDSATTEAPVRRPRVAARLAAVAIAAVFLLPLEAGVRLLQIRVPEGCMEYCDPAGGGRLLIGLGVVGLVLAAGVWRKSLFALAVGLCLSVVSALILGVILIPGALFLGGPAFAPDDQTRMVAVAGAFAIATLLLAIALRESIDEAWSRERSSSST